MRTIAAEADLDEVLIPPTSNHHELNLGGWEGGRRFGLYPRGAEQPRTAGPGAVSHGDEMDILRSRAARSPATF